MKDLTQAQLKELLHYDPKTGLFTWKIAVSRAKKRGGFAGTTDGDGYIRIIVKNRAYRAHRLAWLYSFGAFPVGLIDHIDRNRSNNSLANLRIATPAENQQNRGTQRNSASGIKGVCWKKRDKRWIAKISFEKTELHLGSFKILAAAQAAYEIAAAKYHTFQNEVPNVN